MEQVILKFKLPMINDLRIINSIVVRGYNMTYNKFDVIFSGSKGYLDHIRIECEGRQNPEFNTIIDIADPELRTKAGKLRSIPVTIFHSRENGIRIDI